MKYLGDIFSAGYAHAPVSQVKKHFRKGMCGLIFRGNFDAK